MDCQCHVKRFYISPMFETFLLKNVLSPQLVRAMAQNMRSVYSDFDMLGFENTIVPKLEDMALKQLANGSCRAIGYCPPFFQRVWPFLSLLGFRVLI
jgi:hypothetical protein